MLVGALISPAPPPLSRRLGPLTSWVSPDKSEWTDDLCKTWGKMVAKRAQRGESRGIAGDVVGQGRAGRRPGGMPPHSI